MAISNALSASFRNIGEQLAHLSLLRILRCGEQSGAAALIVERKAVRIVTRILMGVEIAGVEKADIKVATTGRPRASASATAAWR